MFHICCQNLESLLLNDFDVSLNKQGIQGERLSRKLNEIAEIGLTSNGGSNRPGYSILELQAKTKIQQWMDQIGFHTFVDHAGNVIGRLPGTHQHLPAIVCGSHVDTVPDGGHFDGVLGILTALEAAEAWQSEQIQLKHPFEIIVFSDEEGTRFNTGFTGSKAMMGDISANQLKHLVDDDNISFAEALQYVHLSIDSFTKNTRKKEEFAAYIELHIEQGRQLEKYRQSVGIVSGIAGQFGINISITGRAEHAGNTPMKDRKDALLVSSEFILEANKVPLMVSDTAVLTVGKLNVYPNGTNVIPGKVHFTIDCRDIHADNLNAMKEKMIGKLKKLQKASPLDIQWEETFIDPPAQISPILMDIQTKVLEAEGYAPIYIPSGAGHDAMIMANHVPSAMFFVRSKNGLSHHPNEWTSLNDCVNATRILKRFLEQLDEEI